MLCRCRLKADPAIGYNAQGESIIQRILIVYLDENNRTLVERSKPMPQRLTMLTIVWIILLTACNQSVSSVPNNGASPLAPDATATINPADLPTVCRVGDECGEVVTVIDGDTIDVRLDGTVTRVRYIGVNTPERDEVCYADATDANAALVAGKTVRLERDTSNTDRYGRLLRYVYVGNAFVNQQLIAEGYGEVVLYGSDDAHYTDFLRFETNAARLGLGCHPTGIFDDDNNVR